MYGMKEIDPDAPRGRRNAITSAVSAKHASVSTIPNDQSAGGGAYNHNAKPLTRALKQTSPI
jgi:hypothetical protein